MIKLKLKQFFRIDFKVFDSFKVMIRLHIIILLLFTCLFAFPLICLTQNNDTIVSSDSTTILGNYYKAIYKSNDTLYLIKLPYDTILKDGDLSYDFEFSDYNNDGYKDLRVYYLTNVPGIQDLLLFDKDVDQFKKVENFNSLPASGNIAGSSYYYSYHRSGCTDMNWDSDLFYIENYQAIRIGNIYGHGCPNDDDLKNAIYIYKTNNEERILVDTIAIDDSIMFYKWDFIEKYWYEHYKEFIKD